MNTKEVVKEELTSKYDRIFKSIFVDENDYTLMEALLSDCLGTNVRVIRYLPSELSVKSIKERVKRLDILIEADGKYINVEIDTSVDVSKKVRNFNYFTAFYSGHTAVGEKYDIKTDFIHIDLAFGIGINNPIIDNYYITSEETGKKYIEKFRIILINMDRLKETWYHKDEKEIERYKHLIMVHLDKRELENYYKNDTIIKKYREKMKKLHDGEDYFHAPFNAVEDAIALENTQREYYQEMKSKEIAKRMIDKNMPIEEIAELTKLSVIEINELKENK